MNNWLTLPLEERKVILQNISEEREKNSIPDYAIEKDWWVTMVLKALFSVDCADSLLFKGGTSLSKGWGLIERFSEDIDIALNHQFFTQTTPANNSQFKKLRTTCRKYVIETLAQQLDQELRTLGLFDYEVQPLLEIDGIPVSSEADPSVILVNYHSISENRSTYVPPTVKVEVSCLSMDVPFEQKHITTIISEKYPDDDQNTDCKIPTVCPTRTFLEKAFLLCEEFQKTKPRSLRMSRHLYDLEKLMDTEYGRSALVDRELYSTIIEHRRKFYHSGYADYDKNYPEQIEILPPTSLRKDWNNDYTELISSFIYGKFLTFEELLERIEELQARFRNL